jgi:hypothetical protein
MKTNIPQSQTRLFERAGESATRSDRRQRKLEFESPLPPFTACPNRRRDDVFGRTVQASPLEGAPNECETGDDILTPIVHSFISDTEHRFAPTTVRQDYLNVRFGLEQVSDSVRVRTSYSANYGGHQPSSEAYFWDSVEGCSHLVIYNAPLPA